VNFDEWWDFYSAHPRPNVTLSGEAPNRHISMTGLDVFEAVQRVYDNLDQYDKVEIIDPEVGVVGKYQLVLPPGADQVEV
jgi:hypothetical protein